jgi:hypothetical protein
MIRHAQAACLGKLTFRRADGRSGEPKNLVVTLTEDGKGDTRSDLHLRRNCTGRRAATSATGPSKRCSTSSSRSTTERMACEGRALPDYVRREFDEFLRCGRLEHGFLRVRCEGCYAERLVAFS